MQNQYFFTCIFYYLYRTPISDHHPTIHQAALVLIELRDLNVDELQVMEQFQAGGCNYTNSFQLVTTGTWEHVVLSCQKIKETAWWSWQWHQPRLSPSTQPPGGKEGEHSYYYHQGLHIYCATCTCTSTSARDNVQQTENIRTSWPRVCINYSLTG